MADSDDSIDYATQPKRQKLSSSADDLQISTAVQRSTATLYTSVEIKLIEGNIDLGRKLFEEANKVFEKRKVDLKNIKDLTINLKSLENPENNKLVVANFGSSGCLKSSSFNYWITGTTQYPLPNNIQTGIDGYTLKPTRVEFTDSKTIEVSAVKEEKVSENEGDKVVILKSFEVFDESFLGSLFFQYFTS